MRADLDTLLDRTLLRRLRVVSCRAGTWKQLRRRYFGARGIQDKGITLYNPAAMRVERYRYRGTQISTPWNEQSVDPTGGRYRRTRHDDPRSLETLQEALA